MRVFRYATLCCVFAVTSTSLAGCVGESTTVGMQKSGKKASNLSTATPTPQQGVGEKSGTPQPVSTSSSTGLALIAALGKSAPTDRELEDAAGMEKMAAKSTALVCGVVSSFATTKSTLDGRPFPLTQVTVMTSGLATHVAALKVGAPLTFSLWGGKMDGRYHRTSGLPKLAQGFKGCFFLAQVDSLLWLVNDAAVLPLVNGTVGRGRIRTSPDLLVNALASFVSGGSK